MAARHDKSEEGQLHLDGVLIFVDGQGHIIEMTSTGELFDRACIDIELPKGRLIGPTAAESTSLEIEMVRWSKNEDPLYLGPIQRFESVSCRWSGVAISRVWADDDSTSFYVVVRRICFLDERFEL